MRICQALAQAHIDPLDAEVLLAAACVQTRTWLQTHAEAELTAKQMEQFCSWVARRQQHEPVAYIIGEKEFYGRPFQVDARVLIPRPATEALVDLTLDFLKTGRDQARPADTDISVYARSFSDVSAVQTVVDVGTGSGCIAVTLALELPSLHIIASDTSLEALAVAEDNAKRHVVADRIAFAQGALLDPVADLQQPFIVVSNPPYIPTDETLMPDVSAFEPSTALYAGLEGVDVLAPLVQQCARHEQCRGLVVECRSAQQHLFSRDVVV